MNWGIVSLLGTILLVLAGIAAFFVSLARKSAALSRAGGAGIPPASQKAPAGAAASASRHQRGAGILPASPKPAFHARPHQSRNKLCRIPVRRAVPSLNTRRPTLNTRHSTPGA
jgi:hypothetical protein